jgi:hypothetical protein
MAAAHLFGLGDAQMQPPLPQQAAPPPPAAQAPAPKKKRNQPGNPSKYPERSPSFDVAIPFDDYPIIIHTILIQKKHRPACRSRRGGDRAVPQDAAGDEPVRVRGVQQGVPAGAEPAAAPARAQPAVEAEAEEPQGDAAAGVPVPGADVRPPQPVAGAGRPHRDQEALLPEARREEVEVRQVQQALRRAVRLEGALQDLRHARVPLRLRHPLLQVSTVVFVVFDSIRFISNRSRISVSSKLAIPLLFILC